MVAGWDARGTDAKGEQHIEKQLGAAGKSEEQKKRANLVERTWAGQRRAGRSMGKRPGRNWGRKQGGMQRGTMWEAAACK